VSEWAISAVFCIAVSWLAVDAQPEDLTMTIPTVVETHWLNTVPVMHAIHEDQDMQMQDWLHLGEMPAPTAPLSTGSAGYPEGMEDKPGLLERLVIWMLGPKP
jgi:hypothetical protein